MHPTDSIGSPIMGAAVANQTNARTTMRRAFMFLGGCGRRLVAWAGCSEGAQCRVLDEGKRFCELRTLEDRNFRPAAETPRCPRGASVHARYQAVRCAGGKYDTVATARMIRCIQESLNSFQAS